MLSSVFSAMVRWGIVESNPCKVAKSFTEKPRDRYVEDWEYQAVIALASPVLRAAMEIAAITGMRQGDILKLRHADLTDTGPPSPKERLEKNKYSSGLQHLKKHYSRHGIRSVLPIVPCILSPTSEDRLTRQTGLKAIGSD